MASTFVLRALLVVALCSLLASGQQCDVEYTNGTRPLLFGGATERCQQGCQKRDDFWGKFCAFRKDFDPKLVCSAEATNTTLELAKTLGNGSALDLGPCELMRYLRGRTLWLIGDSHARSFFRAMQCFLIDFWDHQECKASLNDEENAKLLNLPVAPGGATCMHLLGPASGRVCVVHVVKGTSLLNNTKVAEGGVLPLLHKSFAQPQDIFYINFGIWHKNSEWQHSYIPALENLGSYYNATKSKFPHVVFRETPAQHKKDENATASCAAPKGFLYNTTTGELLVDPLAREQARSFEQAWLLGIPLNKVANQILPKYDLPIIPTFNLTVLLYNSHAINPEAINTDCKHYCHPGLPQIWISYLYEFLRSSRGVTPIANKERAGYSFSCKIMKSALYLDK